MPLPASPIPVLTVFQVGLALWVALVLLVTVRQNRLLFGRTTRVLRTVMGPNPCEVEPAVLRRPDGVTLHGLICIPPSPPKNLVLWLGGRNEDITWIPDLASWLPPGFVLVAFNYRGMGLSTGSPSQVACVDDAKAIADQYLRRFHLHPHHLHLAGRSLGASVALQLAARMRSQLRQPASLMLQTPPKSIPALIACTPSLIPLLPLAPFLGSPFDSIAASRRLQCPALVLLSEVDRRIPHRHSKAVAASLRAAGATVLEETIPGTDHCSIARHPHAMYRVAQWLHSVSEPSPRFDPHTTRNFSAASPADPHQASAAPDHSEAELTAS